MKKTFTINISGSIFHIDEDAYQKLQEYLQSINVHFGANEEGREIIVDIEARIAEIFREKIKSKDQVVTIELVEEAITIMGKPEEIFEGDEEAEEAASDDRPPRGKRRLYRDPDNRVLGGVASGIAAYFGIDVVLTRALFVIFFFLGSGITLLIYIILWIIAPKAITTAQKLEMQGKDINVSNIEQSIKDEYKEVKKNFKKMRAKSEPHVRDTFDNIIDFLGVTFRFIFKVLIILLGVGFIIAGFVTLVSFIGSMIFAHSFIGPFSELYFPGSTLFHMFFSNGSITLFTIGALLVIGIPFLLLIFVGLKMLFSFKTNTKLIGLSALGAWVAGIILLMSVSFGQIKSYMNSGTKHSETYALENLSSDTLYLRTADNIDYQWYEDHIDLDPIKIITKEDEIVIFGQPTLDVEEGFSDNFEIKLRRSARGSSRRNAIDNAGAINYEWRQTGSSLVFNKYFTLPEGEKWRNQKLHINLKVPRGKVIFLDDSMDGIIYDIENVSNTWDYDMLGKMWIMKREGLTELENR